MDVTFVKRLFSFRFKEAFEGFPYKFLIAIGAGVGLAVFSLARFLSWALTNHPVLVWAFFFGLVLASVLAVQKRLEWSALSVLFTALASVGAYILVGLAPVETTEAIGFLFLSGAIAICAMILPGISGSFILLLLGKYQFILTAVVTRDLVTLFIFSCGCGFGLLSFSRLLRWLLHHYHNITVAALIGLMIGSLRKVWPWKETVETYIDRHGIAKPLVQNNTLPETMNPEVGFAIALTIVGFVLVLVLDKMDTGRDEV